MKLRKKDQKNPKQNKRNKTGLSYLRFKPLDLCASGFPEKMEEKKSSANYKLSHEKKTKEASQATAMLNINTKGTIQKVQPEEDSLLSFRQELQSKWPSAKHGLQRNRWEVRLCPAKTAYNIEKQDFQTQEMKRTMHRQYPPQHSSKSFSPMMNERVWKSEFIPRKKKS